MCTATAISSIIKALVLDRDKNAPVMCRKIHRAVRALRIHPLELYSAVPACARRVLVKDGVPPERATTAVLA